MSTNLSSTDPTRHRPQSPKNGRWDKPSHYDDVGGHLSFIRSDQDKTYFSREPCCRRRRSELNQGCKPHPKERTLDVECSQNLDSPSTCSTERSDLPAYHETRRHQYSVKQCQSSCTEQSAPPSRNAPPFNDRHFSAAFEKLLRVCAFGVALGISIKVKAFILLFLPPSYFLFQISFFPDLILCRCSSMTSKIGSPQQSHSFSVSSCVNSSIPPSKSSKLPLAAD